MDVLQQDLWCYLHIDDTGLIRVANAPAERMIGQKPLAGRRLAETIPWMKTRWLKNECISRVVKTSQAQKLLLDVMPDDSAPGFYHICFRRFTDYVDTDHLWCEVADSIIGVQKFIDTSYDGMVVSDGAGNILAVNDAFVHISGLAREAIVGRNARQLMNEGVLPYSCLLQALENNEASSSVEKYANGKEAIVSATPLTDSLGRIIRVISNVRDLSSLNTLHEKLKNAKDLAKGFQRELKAIQAANVDAHRSLARSRAMEHLYELVHKVASTDLQLLITGESGVGKTALAKYVHMVSERSAGGNFIHVNCSAIPETLLESELFGYEEGSFTGAKKSKAGLFELANKGTLFLDEIGDMPQALQAKLLNVLQEGKFYRVGGVKEIEVDVRIIAATNTKIETLMAQGRFRRDLFYRLNVIPIRVPSLAERKEDIPPLVVHYLEKCNSRYRKKKAIAPEAMDLFLHYNWPGNIRELINLIERIVVIIDEPLIEVRHLMEVAENTALLQFIHNSARKDADNAALKLWQPGMCLKDIVQMIEEEIIDEAVASCGSLKEASKSLGVDVTTLIRKRGKKNRRPQTHAAP